MKVTVRYFASIREAAGTASEVIDTSAADTEALRAQLMQRGGPLAEGLAPGKPVRIALDQILLRENAPLTEGCEVAFFPPVTGG